MTICPAVEATALEMMKRRGQDHTDQTKWLGWVSCVESVARDTKDFRLSTPLNPLARVTRAAYLKNLNAQPQTIEKDLHL